FISSRQDDGVPFFCYLATNAPHAPFHVAETYSQPYVDAGVPQPMANFYGMITNIDENIGRLRDQLDEWGLAENTLLIFMTDNGTAAGMTRPRPRTASGERQAPDASNPVNQWTGFNAGMRGTKGSEYDGGHRVPCFVHWPAGGLTGGRDVDQLTAHIDLLPTLVELCGIKKPEGPPLDGTSLLPILQGDDDALRDRTLFVHSQRLEHVEKWRKCAVMTDRWRFVNGKELYEIRSDPGQQHD